MVKSLVVKVWQKGVAKDWKKIWQMLACITNCQ